MKVSMTFLKLCQSCLPADDTALDARSVLLFAQTVFIIFIPKMPLWSDVNNPLAEEFPAARYPGQNNSPEDQSWLDFTQAEVAQVPSLHYQVESFCFRSQIHLPINRKNMSILG